MAAQSWVHDPYTFWEGRKFLLVGSLWGRCFLTPRCRDDHFSSIFGGVVAIDLLSAGWDPPFWDEIWKCHWHCST